MPGMLIIGAPTTIAEDGKKKKLWWDYDLVARRVLGRQAVPWDASTWQRVTEITLGALAASRRVFLGLPDYDTLNHPYIRVQREFGLVAVLTATGRPRHGLIQQHVLAIQRDLVAAAAHLDIPILDTLADVAAWIKQKEREHEEHDDGDGALPERRNQHRVRSAEGSQP